MKFTLALMLCIQLTIGGNLLVKQNSQGAQVQGTLVLQNANANTQNSNGVVGGNQEGGTVEDLVEAQQEVAALQDEAMELQEENIAIAQENQVLEAEVEALEEKAEEVRELRKQKEQLEQEVDSLLNASEALNGKVRQLNEENLAQADEIAGLNEVVVSLKQAQEEGENVMPTEMQTGNGSNGELQYEVVGSALN